MGELKSGSDGRTHFRWPWGSILISCGDKQYGFDVDSKGYPQLKYPIGDYFDEYPTPDKIA